MSTATAAPAPAAGQASAPFPGGEFNPRRETWKLFMQRFEAHLVGTGQTGLPDARKQGLFLSICGVDVLRMANAVANPQSVWEMDWSELKERLQAHYAPKPTTLSQRMKFHTRVQREGESIADFLAALRFLATDCEFDNQLDWLIRDRLILGIRDDKARRKLATRVNLTLAAAVEELLALEASQHPNQLKTQDGVFLAEAWEDGLDDLEEDQDGDLLQVRATRQPKMAARPHQGSCAGCKGNHARSSCPFLHANCNNCGRKGHIQRACRALPSNQFPSASGYRGPKGPNNRRPPNTGDRSNINRRPTDDCYTILGPIQQASSNRNNIGAFSTKVSVCGKACEFQIDSGSPVTIVPWQTAKELMPHIQPEDLKPTTVTLRDCQGKPIPLRGQIQVWVTHNDFAQHLPLIVAGRKFPKLLGRDWFRALKMTIRGDINNIAVPTTPTEDIFSDFQDVFNGELGQYRGTPISFSLNPNIPPVRLKPRRVPLALKPKVDEQLNKLIAQGILVPVDYAKWETPIVTPIKPDGSLRICADYKCSVNKALEWNAYPVPVIQHLLHSLGEGKIFAKLDLAQAYQQLPVDEQTAEAQTIVTHRGAFKCTRLQFGISTAPGIFQSLMERLLQGIPGVTPYFDDILIAAADHRDLASKLRTTLQRFRTAGLKLNKNKCLIGVPSVEFLGYKIDASGIHPTNSKIAAIQNAPAPTNKLELQAFLGLLNFYSIFLKNKATIAEPLHKLLTKSAPWAWGEPEQKAFRAVKSLISSDSLLVQYSEDTPLQLTCDASPFGVGAVLSHIFPNGRTAPIAFYSRTLSTAERNYSQLDKEALAAVAGIKRFHDYLYGRKFMLVTDHKPLLGIIAGNKQTPQVLSPRMTRWIEFLAAYSYELQYQPGSQISHADALSRAPANSCTPDPAPTLPLLLLEHIPGTPITAETIAQASKKDPTLSTVLHWTLNGWPSQKKGEQFTPFERRQAEISTQRGCLLWGHRTIIPTELQQQILKMIHEGHQGIVRMKSLARSYVWWPNMDKDIELKATTCEPCQTTHSAPPAAPFSKWEQTQNPWSRIHVDFAGPIQGTSLLIIVDSLSNWTEVVPMRSTSAEATIAALQKLFVTHGLPDVLVSDNGPQFVADEFKTFLRSLGIRHATSAPYRPMANGKAERAVRTTKETLARMTEGSLQQKINTFLLAQHSTPSPISNQSPAELLMGRKIKIPLSRAHPNNLTTPPDSPPPRVRTFLGGEGVLARNYTGHPKWLPGTITRPTGPKSYEIALTDGRTWRRHVDQIRRRPTEGNDPSGQTPNFNPHDQAQEDACNLPEAYVPAVPAAEAQQPQESQPLPEQSSPPAQQGTGEPPGTSDPAGGSNPNEVSLRRSARIKKRPAHLNDYTCAIAGPEPSIQEGRGVAYRACALESRRTASRLAASEANPLAEPQPMGSLQSQAAAKYKKPRLALSQPLPSYSCTQLHSMRPSGLQSRSSRNKEHF